MEGRTNNGNLIFFLAKATIVEIVIFLGEQENICPNFIILVQINYIFLYNLLISSLISTVTPALINSLRILHIPGDLKFFSYFTDILTLISLR